ncbi:glycosyltransferase [Candidatus Cetobacterium colombiensis]|uniref:Glycosyltransferase n=1 Tax=Candidatus Cetobacterium colombiensis TaxID=3073100 RepID=A0ABU4W8R5_9FUSO|nr:glycosyltransferase [Candidatus Cetobacterium colombiensis]MDX8335925.1 glycosyltransferase [Candidatus Cetobacterium colombiensis]
MNEKISVVVCVYNRFEYVRNILKSLIEQTADIHEVIFADDGSKTDLQEAIKDLIPLCKFKVKIVWQEDIGFRLAKSRNNAVKFSEGDYIIFMDQDIIFDKDFISKIIKHKKRGNVVYTKALWTDSKQRDEIQKIFDIDYNYKRIYSIIESEQHIKALKSIKKARLYSLLYKFHLRKRGGKFAGLFISLYKDDLLKINGFDEKYIGFGYEDDDLANRLFKSGINTIPVDFEFFPIHMAHPSSPSEAESPNEKYYRDRKKEIFKGDYRCKYGLDNPLGEDKPILKLEYIGEKDEKKN